MPSNLHSINDLSQFKKSHTQGRFVYDQLVSLDISQNTVSLQGSTYLLRFSYRDKEVEDF